MRLFFIVWPFWLAMILGINIWQDATAGRPFNWTNFLGGLGILAGGVFAFLWCRFILKLVRAISQRLDR